VSRFLRDAFKQFRPISIFDFHIFLLVTSGTLAMWVVSPFKTVNVFVITYD